MSKMDWPGWKYLGNGMWLEQGSNTNWMGWDVTDEED